jgi:Na+-transporting NADH:ubiquinone oxidoreductase subunit C
VADDARDSTTRAIVVTLLVCAACSALIATAVTALRPYRESNRERQRTERIREMIAGIPGLADVVGPLASGRIEVRLVDLATGTYVTDADPAEFDAREAERDPERSVALSKEQDRAGIGRRAKWAKVFLVYEGDRLRLLVLPVHGAGYLSTLYGYLALDADLNTIRGLSFYQQEETPGLGSEIENPSWLAQWEGKWLRDPSGRLRIEVVQDGARPGSEAERYQVDGISGATRTGAGVTRLLHFWLGSEGFGPYLERLERQGRTS